MVAWGEVSETLPLLYIWSVVHVLGVEQSKLEVEVLRVVRPE